MKISNLIKWNRSTHHLVQGRRAERIACRFLTKRGLRHVQSNYRCPYGEIDLIMEDNKHLVFIEVRYRSNTKFGGALGSIDHRKQNKLRATAEHYLQRYNQTASRRCRFDVVVLGPANTPTCEWIQDAF